MADGTKIEWTDATANYVNGCSVLSPGCTNCYAMRLAGTRLRHHESRQGLTIDTKAGPVWTGEVRANEKALLEPLRWRRPRKIFWNAHGDLFHENVPFEWVDRQFAVMALTPHHIHQVLTKRPDRMREYLRHRWGDATNHYEDAAYWRVIEQARQIDNDRYYTSGIGGCHWWPLPNVWLGTSVEDQKRADERIPELLATPAAVRFLSCEPLLGPLDLRGHILVPKGGRRLWSTWEWPDWVPLKAREQIESFWSREHGRGPDEWLRGALDNGQPPLGTFGRYSLCRHDSATVEGRFIPAWNNMGRVVDADGNLHVVSAGRWQSPPTIDWIIAGGESGPGARPMHPDWARILRDDCAAAGVAFHFKQWGAWAPCQANEGDWPVNEPGHCRLTATGDRHAGGWPMQRVGKKAAGRLLDGVEHNGMPA